MKSWNFSTYISKIFLFLEQKLDDTQLWTFSSMSRRGMTVNVTHQLTEFLLLPTNALREAHTYPRLFTSRTRIIVSRDTSKHPTFFFYATRFPRLKIIPSKTSRGNKCTSHAKNRPSTSAKVSLGDADRVCKQG